MALHGKNSPLIYSYLKKYQEDPSSRVFAPLAEAYRKAGLVDEAIEIAQEGLNVHPNYVGGKVALARALFDKKLYQDVIDVLSEIIKDVPDNLIAQRLLAESYLMLGSVMEALSSYKMLLYFSPHDHETAKIVKELEARAYESEMLVVSESGGEDLSEFDVKNVESVMDQSPEVLKHKWIEKVERLQALLLAVDRYRRGQDFQRSSSNG